MQIQSISKLIHVILSAPSLYEHKPCCGSWYVAEEWPVVFVFETFRTSIKFNTFRCYPTFWSQLLDLFISLAILLFCITNSIAHWLIVSFEDLHLVTISLIILTIGLLDFFPGLVVVDFVLVLLDLLWLFVIMGLKSKLSGSSPSSSSSSSLPSSSSSLSSSSLSLGMKTYRIRMDIYRYEYRYLCFLRFGHRLCQIQIWIQIVSSYIFESNT